MFTADIEGGGMESKDGAGQGAENIKRDARARRESPDATMHGKHRRASMNLERSQLNGPGRSLLPRHGRWETFNGHALKACRLPAEWIFVAQTSYSRSPARPSMKNVDY
jgi:hypothetical protein